MPSTYAHYRFGRDVMASTNGDVCRDIVENLDLYNIGLHGPDILFYHDALVRNRVNSADFAMHDRPGREFFGPARDVLSEMENQSAGRAYLYGFICHFMLDSECHPYIEEKISESRVSHTRIESEFDRAFLERDGFDPFRKDLTAHIHPSADISAVSQVTGNMSLGIMSLLLFFMVGLVMFVMFTRQLSASDGQEVFSDQ